MRKTFLLAFAAATLTAQSAPSTFTPNKGPLKFARDTNKQEEILIRLEKLEEQNTRILKILEEADAPQAPTVVKVDIKGAAALGDESAPITVVEFTDMQCPYCSKFHKDTYPQLHDTYIATGKVRFVSRDLPLPMHKNAMGAAEAGRCAGEQGHYWEMRDWMQSNPEHLEELDLFAHVSSLDNIDLEKYGVCMATGKYRAAVQADMDLARDLNITGTPAFIIGKSGPVIEGEVLMGAQPLQVFANKLK